VLPIRPPPSLDSTRDPASCAGGAGLAELLGVEAHVRRLLPSLLPLWIAAFVTGFVMFACHR